MPELPVLNVRQVIAALKVAGFEVVRQRGSHVRLQHPDGRTRWGSWLNDIPADDAQYARL